MPGFSRSGQRFQCIIQCGAGLDAILQFELCNEPVETIHMYELPRMDYPPDREVDPEQIKLAAQKGLQYANDEFGQSYSLKSIGYCPNESKHYDLHARCVWEIIRHLNNEGEFRELKLSE